MFFNDERMQLISVLHKIPGYLRLRLQKGYGLPYCVEVSAFTNIADILAAIEATGVACGVEIVCECRPPASAPAAQTSYELSL